MTRSDQRFAWIPYVGVIGKGVVVNLVQAVYILLPGQMAFLAVFVLDVVQVERIPRGDNRLVVVFEGFLEGLRVIGPPPVDDRGFRVQVAVDGVVPYDGGLPCPSHIFGMARNPSGAPSNLLRRPRLRRCEDIGPGRYRPIPL